MTNLPAVPETLSAEGRANMIADECGRTEHLGKPRERHAHVKAHAMAHIRAAIEQAARLRTVE